MSPFQDPVDPTPEAQAQLEGPAIVAWESAGRGLWGRWLGTLGRTFSPALAAPELAQGSVGPALRFALLTTLPWMLAWGVVPFTEHLRFEAARVIEVLHAANAQMIALDLARASGLGLVVASLSLLSWALPFISLTSAFAGGAHSQEEARRAALRCVLYVGWVVPFGMTALALAPWLSTTPLGGSKVGVIALAFLFVPRFLVLAHCHTLARQVGASYFGSLVASLVPLLVQMASERLLESWAVTLLPDVGQPGH